MVSWSRASADRIRDDAMTRYREADAPEQLKIGINSPHQALLEAAVLGRVRGNDGSLALQGIGELIQAVGADSAQVDQGLLARQYAWAARFGLPEHLRSVVIGEFLDSDDLRERSMFVAVAGVLWSGEEEAEGTIEARQAHALQVLQEELGMSEEVFQRQAQRAAAWVQAKIGG